MPSSKRVAPSSRSSPRPSRPPWIPVAILADDAGLDHRLQAARFGAVAVVLRTASADAMAQRIAEVARELPERKTEGPTDLGEATLDEVVEVLFARRLRSGVLAVSANGGSERVVLRGDRPVTQAIEELVDRLRPLVTQSDTVRWEFQQSPTGKLAELTLDDEPSGELDIGKLFRDRRIVIVEKSPARADDLVVALRERGAHVVVIDGEGTGLAKARAIDPDVILVDVSGVGGWAGQAMQLIRGDARLRWAALLVTRGEELWRGEHARARHRAARRRHAAAGRARRELDAARARRAGIDRRAPRDDGADAPLRAVGRAGVTVHATVRHRRATIEIDFAQGLIVGARGEVASDLLGAPSSKVEGTAALAIWLGLGFGTRVRIERREAPSVANVMAPIDDAIAAADRETPLIKPSIPPPAGPPSLHPSAGMSNSARPSPSGETDARALVNQLETLLDRLRHTLPPGSLEVPSEYRRQARRQGRQERSQGHATLVANAATAIPPPGKLLAPPPKPGARKATQIGMPVPPGSSRVRCLRPRRSDVPAPASVMPLAAQLEPDPPSAPAADSCLVIRFRRPPIVSAAARRRALRRRRSRRGAIDDDAHPLLAEPDPRPSADSSAGMAGETDLAALLEGEARSVAARSGDRARARCASGERVLEATDQVVLPPPRAEEIDDPIALPGARSRGTTIAILGVTVLVALLAVGAAVAWRMGCSRPSRRSRFRSTDDDDGDRASDHVAERRPRRSLELVPPTAIDVARPPADDGGRDRAAASFDHRRGSRAAPPTTTVAEARAAAAERDCRGRGADRRRRPARRGAEPTASLRPDDPQRLVDRANSPSHARRSARRRGRLSARDPRLAEQRARAAGSARLHLARHDARTASTWARRLAEGHTANAGNYVLLGDTLQAAGDSAGARRAWERAEIHARLSRRPPPSRR